MAVYFTAEELEYRIEKNRDRWIPSDFNVGDGLVYSSPATLAYNSPGAEGYGVKRAALAVPESVELIISPGCCGRNTSDISSMKGYENRFYYLEMDEADLVTGRHLKRIPEAVKKIMSDRASHGLSAPKAVMLVTTCADALLGTDMEHVCRICEDQCDVKVRPAYMYALTRDGVNPPMVQVRESIFSLLEKREKNNEAINILGYFGGLDRLSSIEMKLMLRSIGISEHHELSECSSFDEFMNMSEADFNLVIDPDARGAADYMEKNLGTGYIEMHRFYGIDRITSQYRAFFSMFHADDSMVDVFLETCQKNISKWSGIIIDLDEPVVFSVGECLNGHSPELALALMEYGFRVAEVFCTLSDSDAYYIAAIAEKDPSVRFYFNQHATMVGFEPDPDVNFALGKDAAWYYRDRDVASLEWNSDRQPFGYSCVNTLLTAIVWAYGHHYLGDDVDDKALNELIHLNDPDAPSDGKYDYDEQTQRLLGIMGLGGGFTQTETRQHFVPLNRKKIHGYRQTLTPFAPDQSGAVEVLRNITDMMIVILDAGGCTGNICGFDMPDWYDRPSMLFSAGLRDMDAVLGRDDELIHKIKTAVIQLEPSCIALVGTPVPSVIGTDLKGLAKDVKKATGLDTLAIPTTGLELYDDGIIRTYKELSKYIPYMSHGAYGMTYLDYSAHEQAEITDKCSGLPSDGKKYAFSVGGYSAADENAAPDEIIVSDEMQNRAVMESGYKGPVLIIGEQIYSNALRRIIKKAHPRKNVRVADFFRMIPSLTQPDDVHLREEDDLISLVSSVKPSLIISDPALKDLIPDYHCRWIPRNHFALSGK